MPNWIQGSLKLRGTYENICRFFEEGINVYEDKWNNEKEECEEHVVDKSKWLLIEEFDDGMYVNILDANWAHVNDTIRAFVTTENHDIFISKKEKSDEIDEEPIIVTACEIHQAWSFKPENWLKVSKNFNVDIQLYGIESGIGFEQIVTIIDNTVIENKVNNYGGNYDDFLWHCPIPWLGG